MSAETWGDDPTMMREWNELNEARPIQRRPAEVAASEARSAVRATEQAAYVAQCREEARARELARWHAETSCGRCGEVGCRGECVL